MTFLTGPNVNGDSSGKLNLRIPVGHENEIGKMSQTDLTRSQGFLTSRHMTSHSLTFAQPPVFGTDRIRQTNLPEGITRGSVFFA